MKTNHIFIATAFLLLLAASACNPIPFINNMIDGSGNIITEEREVRGFDRVTLSGFGEVSLEQGTEESLSVRTDDNIMPYVRTEVRNNTLILDFDDKGWDRGYNPTDGIHFDLVVKDLQRIDISGAGSVEMGKFDTDDLLVDLSGAGSLEIGNLTANELIVRQSGAVTMVVAGQVNGQELSHSGVGSYHAAELESETAFIDISGAGSSTVWATETLDIQISGLGNVIYYGNPRVSQDISGLGKLVSGEKK